jgi:hypothetical protein
VRSPKSYKKFTVPTSTHQEFCFSCETPLNADTDSFVTCFECGRSLCKDCSLCACGRENMLLALAEFRPSLNELEALAIDSEGVLQKS